MRPGVGVVASSMANALLTRTRVRNPPRGFERRTSASSTGRDGGAPDTNRTEVASWTPTDASPTSQQHPPLRCYYSDWATVTLPDNHRFPMDKYRATRLVLEGDASLFGRVTMVRSPTARLEDVLSVHCAEYVTRVSTCTLSEKEERAIGFPMRNQEQVTRSFASTGGTIAAMHDVLIGIDDIRDDDDDATNASVPLINSKKPFRLKVACQIAGGTHHAFHDSGEGFCVFNDIACAATVCLGTYGHLPHFSQSETPILVIDLDVHQGNGTAKIFENNSKVVTFSMHGAGNYPWKTKMRSDYDVDLPDDTGDETYLAHLNKWLPYLFSTYHPKLVFYQAGVDALAEDTFGRLAMTRTGMLKRNHLVYDKCVEYDTPLVVTMGGGYSKPFGKSVAAHADVFRSAAYRFGGAPVGVKRK